VPPRNKILIADDDQSLLEAIRVRLEAEVFEVITCQDAYQALACARRERPDLLILDVNMPAGNGFSVHERLAGIEELAGTPVVYITGEARGTVDRDAHALGAFAVLHKPLPTDALLEAVRGALGYWTRESSPPPDCGT
jgi:DNA-binding response OmpR family regulator